MELKKKNHGLFVGVIYFRQRYSLYCLLFFSLHFILNLFISFFTFLSVFFGIIPCSFSIRLLSSLHFILLKVFFFIYFFLCLFSCNSLLLAIACAGLCLLVKFFFFFFFVACWKPFAITSFFIKHFFLYLYHFFCFCLIILMESPARTN